MTPNERTALTQLVWLAFVLGVAGGLLLGALSGLILQRALRPTPGTAGPQPPFYEHSAIDYGAGSTSIHTATSPR